MADTITSLKKKMRYVGIVYNGKWSTVRELVEFLNANKDTVKILDKEIYQYNKGLDFFDLHTWSTYADTGCINLEFSINKKTAGSMICYARIWNGSSYDGRPTNQRFSVRISIPDAFIKMIEDSVNNQFTTELEMDYDKYLEKQKLDWIKAHRAKVLKGGK